MRWRRRPRGTEKMLRVERSFFLFRFIAVVFLNHIICRSPLASEYKLLHSSTAKSWQPAKWLGI